MPKKYDVILFDMDGTLIDTDELIAQTFFCLYDKYNNGKRATREEMVYFSGPPIRETLAKEFPQINQEELFQEFHDISWRLYPQYLKSFPFVKDALIELKKDHYRLGIVTNKMHGTTQYCLELLNMNNIFDVVIGIDDVNLPKPHSEGIFKAMDILNQPEKVKVLYIGDNGSDFLTSQNAGIDCGLITWGPRALNSSLKPKYFVKSFRYLKEVIENESSL
ncbi:MAG: HAD family hydrolase [Bacilli bacterium]|jgi:HAD superfamily hydrolase (TIGR01549 family)|nr:HAD family hydrolase [Bacilli bacterium]MDD3841481.1 HAD family hydrolase [Bacilli bacterium]HKM10588.1 HAD family hydrolase [Bacilli bacterium]